LGTPTYMAPEQCRGITVDHRADLYALGCLIFRVCTGRPPFVGAIASDVLSSHIYGSPPLLGSFAPEIPPAAEALVQRLLAKRPDDRPQRAEDVIQHIDDVLQRAPSVGSSADMALAVPPAGTLSGGERTATGSQTAMGSAIGAGRGRVTEALEPSPAATATGVVSEPAVARFAGARGRPRSAAPAGAAAARRAATHAPRRAGRHSLVWLGAALATTAFIASIGIATCDGTAVTVEPQPAAILPPDRAAPVAPAALVGAALPDPPAPAARSTPATAAAPAEPEVVRGGEPEVAVDELASPGRPARPAARVPSHGASAAAKSSRARVAAAERVDVAIDSRPAGAEVVLGDAVLGRTPFRGKLPRGAGTVRFELKLGGYARKQLVVRTDKRISRSVALDRLPAPAPVIDRDQSVNPFAR
ncbi:MAG TPA: PEGA domain-containing protein, partial [Kofleriaceae bacterium]|nr:PEGA domain-containing protein [Kofleriaceae bacterium]